MLSKGQTVPDGHFTSSQLDTLTGCGALVREVLPDGDAAPAVEPAGGRPAKRDDKATWVAYAVEQGLLDAADADKLTKPELIARVEELEAKASTPPADPPAEDPGAADTPPE